MPVPPFPTANVPVNKFVPIDVVATTWPLAFVERIALLMPENHVVPRVASVEDALANDWSPVHEFALASSEGGDAMHVPLIAKHPAAKLMPPVEWKVLVAGVKLATLLTERMEPGVVVPMPMLLLVVLTKSDEVALKLVPVPLKNANSPAVPVPTEPFEMPVVYTEMTIPPEPPEPPEPPVAPPAVPPLPPEPTV